MRFRFPGGYDEARLIGELSRQYSIRKGRSRSFDYAICDTFDWRLFHRSLVLEDHGKKLVLRNLTDGAELHLVDITSSPVFSDDLPDGAMKEQLAPILKARALIRLAAVDSRSTPYRVLGRNGKTVARLAREEHRLSGDKEKPPLATYLRLKPAKGYLKNCQALRERLEKAGFTGISQEDLYIAALAAAGKIPGDYSTKVAIPLTPDMRSEEAMRIILRFLSHVVRINEAQLEKDLDTEFLHDFRVAIRRIRSALGQMKGVFPAEITDRLRKDFSYLGKLSNELRDFDVHLLNEEAYKAMLPAKLRDDIEPLFADLREKRSGAFREFIARLKARECREIFRGWEAFLEGPRPVSPEAPNADLPIRDRARKRIYKKFRRVLKIGNEILGNGEEEMLHLLRIECKELRYLMEFFASLFPRGEIRGLVDSLRTLQDILGEFNDFCVQERYFLHIAKEWSATGTKSARTLVAIGTLIGTLEGKKQRGKDAFSKTFAGFVSTRNRKSFQELFDTRSYSP